MNMHQQFKVYQGVNIQSKTFYVSDCFFQQGNMQFALADYHQALDIDPTDESIKSRIAIVHNEYGVQEYQEKNYQVTTRLYVHIYMYIINAL